VGTARRVTLTLAVYAVAACLLWIGIPAFERLLLLPQLFPLLAKGALLVGAPLAALAAWRYPHMGGGGEGE
jgi:hypothetical protein